VPAGAITARLSFFVLPVRIFARFSSRPGNWCWAYQSWTFQAYNQLPQAYHN